MKDYMLFLLLLLSIAATSTTGSTTTVGPVNETTKTADSTTEPGAAGSTATTAGTTGSTATTAGTAGSTATGTAGSTATGTAGSTATGTAGSTATGTAGSTATGTAGSTAPGGLSCFSCTGQAKEGACDIEQESKASKTQCAADEFCQISSIESNGNYTVVRGCTKSCGSTYYERHCEITKETECKKCCKTNNCNAESFSSGNRSVGSCVALLIGTLLVGLTAF